MDKRIGYKRTYKMRRLIPNRDHISITLPFEVVAREATNAGLAVDDFIKTFVVVVEYDNFDGVRYAFARKEVAQDDS